MARDKATHSGSKSASDAQNERHNWWISMLLWREKHLPDKTFVVLLALIVARDR